MGQQPATTELSGSAAQNRFKLLFQKFLQLFTQKEHPLVIFLDDLQWADSASLQLIKLLVSDCHQGYLLLIGAYRDNEVSPLHPLMLTLDAVSKTEAIINLLTLQPLSQLSLNKLVADTLKSEKKSAFFLSELIYRKTKGNPFFATQFLKSLHQDEMIQFNWEDKCWQCDISQINQQALTDDVVDLIILQLQKLPESTQEVLKLAACIGNQFDLATLAIVEEKSELETAINLWSALQKGLVLPQSEVYKLYQHHSFVNSQQKLNHDDEPIKVPYKFLHDRIQQAAYALIPHKQKQATHLQIGRLLLQSHSQQQKEEGLFEIVGQFRLGESLITDPAEKLLLAEYNWKASQKAIASTAYTSAFDYATSGLSLLGKSAWNNHYSLTLNLYNLAAEAAYLMGNLGSMEEYAAEISQQAHSLTDTVKITEIKVEAYTNQGQFTLAINTALDLLNKLEINVSKQPDLAEIPAAFQAIAQQLNGRLAAELLDLPPMTNPAILAAMRILVKVGAASYACKPELFPLVILKQVELSLKYGNANTSIVSYVSYGLLLCSVLEDFSTGDEFGQMALELGDRLNDQEFYGRTLVLAHHYITFCTNHARASLAPLQQAYNRSLEAGDLVFAGFAGFTYNFNSYLTGKPLKDLINSINIYNQALEQIGQQTALNFIKPCHQSALNLLGQSVNPVILTGEAMDETTMLEMMTEMGDQSGLWLLLINKLYLCFLFDEYSQTLKIAQQIRQYIGGGSGTLTVPILYFYESLAFLATSGDGEIITANQEIIQKRALYAPMNFRNCSHSPTKKELGSNRDR
ncbi:AAA family ATPase, partial [Dolichospermum sp. UHCC 0259]|uniref:ATP-binding protein n=1 Tax=Dolichospermum sp. UHCC 0259 TaxID=2590010 RepID=UPI00352A975F